jgi:hypothetical protein
MSTDTIRTYCAQHLGDNLVHLNFLRRLAAAHPAGRFVHAARAKYLPQLIQLVQDLPNLSLLDIRSTSLPAEATGLTPAAHGGASDHSGCAWLNAWRGAQGYWHTHPHRLDFVAFHLAWFADFASWLGLPDPIAGDPTRLLFDYPAIADFTVYAPFDVLVINSRPLSGQAHDAPPAALDRLAADLAGAGRRVVTTAPVTPGIPCTQRQGLTVTAIGGLSVAAAAIVGYATGPAWPTWCVANHARATLRLRLVLSDAEQVSLSPSTQHCTTVPEARRVLQVSGLL